MYHKVIVALLFVLFSRQVGFCWGFEAHQEITQLAVFSLPPELLPLYRSQLNYLKMGCLAPDKRRYVTSEEGPKHYFTVEILETAEEKWKRSFWKQPADSVLPKLSLRERESIGRLPWHLMTLRSALINAFKQRKAADILYLSAEISHYLADACVPLHCTENFNGQKTNQGGVHKLWETTVTHLLLPQADLMPRKATYLPDLQDVVWQTIQQSHSEVDTVLREEQGVRRHFPPERWFTAGSKANGKPVYSDEYVGRYANRMKPMVERKVRTAAWLVASFWYSCWVEAGQPNLIPAKEGDLPPNFLKEISALPASKDGQSSKIKGKAEYLHFDEEGNCAD
jgi:hypothetical protein